MTFNLSLFTDDGYLVDKRCWVEEVAEVNERPEEGERW